MLGDLFSHLTSGPVNNANLLGHLYEHRHQARLPLQLLSQRPAAAVSQGCLHLTEPTAVVRVVVCFLQQPASM